MIRIRHSLFGLILSLAGLMPAVAHADDICDIRYTLMHYFQASCRDVPREIPAGAFHLHSALVAKDLAAAKSRPTLVLIPGGPGSSAEPLKTAMQKRELLNGFMAHLNANILMYDPRGTGLSPLPVRLAEWTSAEISTEAAVEDLRAVIRAHGIGGPVVLFAHSAGGHVALRFAEKYPAEVQGMILVSVSTSPRRMSLLNQALMSAEPLIWNLYRMDPAAASTLSMVESIYLRAEDVVRQQQKARLLHLNPIANFRVLSPLVLRQQLILRMNQDPTGEMAAAWLLQLGAEMDRLKKEYRELVPASLREARLTINDLPPEWLNAKGQIQRLIMGGEGTFADELERPSHYEGLSLGDLWGDEHLPAGVKPIEPDPFAIATPTVFLTGGRDVVVPPAATREFAEQMPNATWIQVNEADHEFFNAQPMAVYSAVEKLLSRISAPAVPAR